MTEHKLPELGYAYDALEPHIDEGTMKIHHSKHHKAYVDKLNAAIKDHKDLMEKSLEDLIKNIENIPEPVRTAVRNNGGGHLNHSFFWSILKKDVEPSGDILDAITSKFGSLDDFKDKFSKAAISVFGSGWAWLVVNDKKELEIVTTANQNNPISQAKKPVMGIDLWEHAYYLKYQNRRPEYIDAFFNVINWEKVNEYFLNNK